jgi:hypothetical protein
MIQDGVCSKENALNREFDDTVRNANRTKACPDSWAKPRPAGYSCDEYPMASTVQGAANPSIPSWGRRNYIGCQMGAPYGTTGPNGYSACFIDKDKNDLQGGLMSGFYEGSKTGLLTMMRSS